MRRFSLFFLLFLFACSRLIAQPTLDILAVTSQFALTHSMDSAGEVTRIQEHKIAGKVPVKLKNGDLLLVGGSGSQLVLQPEKSASTHLAAIGLTIGYIRNWNAQWSTQFIGLPAIATSKNRADGSGNDFQPGGFVLTAKKVTEQFKFRLGLYYNREFFGNFFVPLLGIDWKPDSTWQLYGNLPVNFTVLNKFRPRLQFGFNFTGIINSYGMSSGLAYMQRSTNDFSLFSDFYLDKKSSIVFQLKAGYSLARRFRVYDRNDQLDFAISALKFGEDRVQLNSDLKDSPFIQLGLFFRVKTD